MTLLHSSDLHLQPGVEGRESWLGFQRVLDLASRLAVDGVLIAGDLFDSGQVRSGTVQQVFQALAALQRPVIVLPGNHDAPLTEERSPLGPLPENVYLLKNPSGELVHIAGLGLWVWGKPVYDHEPSFHPLQGVPARPPAEWYVVMAHGLVMDGHTGSSRSSPITLQELAQADCDYIALGHVHVFREVTQGKAPAFYCGAPSGLLQRTAALVTLEPLQGAKVQAVPVP